MVLIITSNWYRECQIKMLYMKFVYLFHDILSVCDCGWDKKILQAAECFRAVGVPFAHFVPMRRAGADHVYIVLTRKKKLLVLNN